MDVSIYHSGYSDLAPCVAKGCARQFVPLVIHVIPADIPKKYVLYHVLKYNKSVYKKELFCHLPFKRVRI